MTSALKLSHRLIYFTGVGVCAAIVHLLIVFNLVNFLNLQPLLTNVIAFLIAFNVSYLGHKYFTFNQLQDEKQLSLPHFFWWQLLPAYLMKHYIICYYASQRYIILLP